MCCSKAPFIGHFCILRADQVLILSTRVLLSDSAILYTLYYVLDARLFLLSLSMCMTQKCTENFSLQGGGGGADREAVYNLFFILKVML
jgi:hypothetical protein